MESNENCEGLSYFQLLDTAAVDVRSHPYLHFTFKLFISFERNTYSEFKNGVILYR